jgi:2'-5' RNA ligase
MIKESKPWAKIASIGVFSSSSEYDVLYLGIDSPDLMDIREKLESAVESVQTHPKYNPHATIAYLKKGTSSKYTSLEVPTMTFRLDKFFFSRKDARKILIPMSGIDKSKRIFLST